MKIEQIVNKKPDSPEWRETNSMAWISLKNPKMSQSDQKLLCKKWVSINHPQELWVVIPEFEVEQ